MNAWKPVLAALTLFAAGVVTGGLTVNLRPVVARALQSRPPRPETVRPTTVRPLFPTAAENQLRELGAQIEDYLELTPDQKQRILAIVAESQARMKALAEEVNPRTREEMRRVRELIREELEMEQRRKFEELFKNRFPSRRPEGATNRPSGS